MDAELELQIDNISSGQTGQEHVTTSLCDRFEIHMYSEEFIQNEKEYSKQQKAQGKEILQAVFYNTENEDTARYFRNVMESSTETIVKKEYTPKREANSFGMVPYVMAGMLVAGIACYFLERRKRNENHDHIKKSYNRETV